ncbi:MAG: hypothetical protein Q9167_005328 [Letrouitia subvulpina]
MDVKNILQEAEAFIGPAISRALTHLKNLHDATNLNFEDAADADILNSPQPQKVVQGLIDLIILEGIYPALSPGVGVPIEKRMKSILKGGLVAIPSAELRIPEADQRFLLMQIVDELVPVIFYNGSTSILIKERIMIDLIAALGDLAYSPFSSTKSKDKFDSVLNDLLKSTMSADTYFAALAPQLLQLLDDTDLDNKRVASYIIGTGILSRRKVGAPGTIGWKLFAQSILGAFNPPANKVNPLDYDFQQIQFNYDGLTPLIDTEQALERLSSLVLFHPNPGLVKRLVSSTFVSLWSLECFADERRKSALAEQAWKILVTFCKISGDRKEMFRLGENLLSRGGPDWEYFERAQGGIAVRPHFSNQEPELDATKMIQIIDRRTEKFMDLIKSAVLDNSQIMDIADHFSSRWLNTIQSGSHETLRDNEDIEDPLNHLLSAKITQRMFEEYKDLLATNPSSILKLVDQIIASFITDTKTVLEKKKNASRPSIFGLGEMTCSQRTSETERDEYNVAISTALSLISALLSSPDFSLDAVPDALFQNLRRNITTLSSYRTSVPNSLVMSAASVAAMLDFEQHDHVPSRSDNGPSSVHQITADRTTYRTALAYLTDTLTPVRAQGLSLLTSLVSEDSPILDVQATVTLLLSLLQDEDEYVYLSSINTIKLLGSKHPRTVTQMLVEKYADADEESNLDVRIKVGEALLKTVEHLRAVIPQDTAEQLGNTLINVASRRGNRTKEMVDRKRVKKDEERSRERAEKGWDRGLPSVDEDDPEREANETIARIIEGWADTGHEEDIRIRTSALSILGTAIETNAQNLGPIILSAAVDCAIAILKLEITAERAILRRAGAMIIGSVIKALDAAEERGQSIRVGFEGDNLADIITVLRYVEATDTDDLVVGHLGTLTGDLNIWREKLALGLYKSKEDSGIRVGLENGRLAGLAIDPGKPSGTRPKIEEVD